MHHRVSPDKWRRFDSVSLHRALNRRRLCLALSRCVRHVLSATSVSTALEVDVVRTAVRLRKRRKCNPRQLSFHRFRARPYLLTRNETAFFRVLATVIGHRYLISCKVRLADIVTCDEQDWRRGHANRIAQKHIDFVIADIESSRIIAAIELDDRSHDRPDRQERDEFINALFLHLDIRLIRFPAAWRYSRQSVENAITVIR